MDKISQRFYEMKIDYMNNTPEGNKKEKRDKIYRKYLALNLLKRQEIIEIIYPVLRDYLSERFSNSDYEGIIETFGLLKNTIRYKNEPIANRCITENILLRAYLYLCLESGGSTSSYFSEVETLVTSVGILLQEKREFSYEQYENETKIYSENVAIYDSLISGDFWTEVNLTLPFPLGISKEILNLIVLDEEVQLSTEKFRFGESLFDVDRGVLQLTIDKYGLLTRTAVTLRIKKFFSMKNEKLYFFGENESRSTLLISSLNILNEIISRYRLIGNNYWVDNIDSRMIQVSSVKFIASGVIVKNIIAQSENTYIASPEYDYNKPKENEQLVRFIGLDRDEFLWQELLADAKSFLLVSKLREAVISLNSSFENLFYTRFRKILSIYEDDEKIDSFFEGDIVYEDFRSKDLIDEETFYELKKAGVFPAGVPSVYKVIGRYYKIVPVDQQISYSKRQLLKAINKIRMYRNDIVHGNLYVDALTDKHVFEAIEEFVKLSTEIEKRYKS
ncbi:hypothetical protein EJX06_11635 [Enterococcus faecium]|nr:hypothetical protein [Enterococcus faecium]